MRCADHEDSTLSADIVDEIVTFFASGRDPWMTRPRRPQAISKTLASKGTSDSKQRMASWLLDGSNLD